MGKSNTWAQAALDMIFLNINPLFNLGSGGARSPSASNGNIYISLHTGDPGTAGDQTTNECNYTGYARVAVPRSIGSWTVAGPAYCVVNAAAITFPLCTGGANTVAFFGVGTDASGAGQLLYSFPLQQYFFAATGKASSDVFTAPGHIFVVNDTVEVTTPIGGSLPSGLALNTIYYVKTVSGNDITLSATLGGATLDITTDGDAFIGKIATLAVSNGITPQFGIGALTIAEF